MLKIAICDDELKQVIYTEKMINKYFCEKGRQIEIDTFIAPYSLINEFKRNASAYQLVFLDIEMEAIDGITTANVLREINQEFILIFLTNYDNYALRSFEVLPFRYLLKQDSENKLFAILKCVEQELDLKNKFLFYKIGRDNFQVRTDDIVLLSSEFGRKIRVRLKGNQSLEFYDKIRSLESQLPVLNFIKVNSGTIINLNFVKAIMGDEILLENEEKVHVSRRNRKNFKEKYRHFIESCVGV